MIWSILVIAIVLVAFVWHIVAVNERLNKVLELEEEINERERQLAVRKPKAVGMSTGVGTVYLPDHTLERNLQKIVNNDENYAEKE